MGNFFDVPCSRLRDAGVGNLFIVPETAERVIVPEFCSAGS
jgi:hypothetical protein